MTSHRGKVQATHLQLYRRGNCFGRCEMMSSTTPELFHAGNRQKTSNMSAALSLRNSEAVSCCSPTVCGAEPSSNMKIIHLASVCQDTNLPCFLSAVVAGPSVTDNKMHIDQVPLHMEKDSHSDRTRDLQK